MKTTSSFMIKVLRVGEPQRALKINAPKRALKYWKSVVSRQSWFDENKEHVIVLLLSVQNDIQGYSLVSIGTVNETITAPREIFRAAIAAGAHGIIAMHNHPSGHPEPSKTDRAFIDHVNEAGELLQIRVRDHIIVGKNGKYYSFVEEAGAITEKNRRRRKSRKRRPAVAIGAAKGKTLSRTRLRLTANRRLYGTESGMRSIDVSRDRRATADGPPLGSKSCGPPSNSHHSVKRALRAVSLGRRGSRSGEAHDQSGLGPLNGTGV